MEKRISRGKLVSPIEILEVCVSADAEIEIEIQYVQRVTEYVRTDRDSLCTYREGQCLYVQIGIAHVPSDSVCTLSDIAYDIT